VYTTDIKPAWAIPRRLSWLLYSSLHFGRNKRVNYWHSNIEPLLKQNYNSCDFSMSQTLRTNAPKVVPGLSDDHFYEQGGLHFSKGDPLGEFRLGSTMVLIYEVGVHVGALSSLHRYALVCAFCSKISVFSIFLIGLICKHGPSFNSFVQIVKLEIVDKSFVCIRVVNAWFVKGGCCEYSREKCVFRACCNNHPQWSYRLQSSPSRKQLSKASSDMAKQSTNALSVKDVYKVL